MPHPTLHTTTAHGRALVFAPHPDDEAFACGGTLALHRLAGYDVRVIVLTDGARGDTAESPDDYVALRQRECRDGCAALGIDDCAFWNLPDRGLVLDSALIAKITGALDAYRPQVVYVPSPQEQNPDHKAAAHAVWLAVRALPCRDNLVIRFTEAAFPTVANCLVDTTETAETKLRAARCHESQLGGLHYLEAIAALTRFRALSHPTACAAEAFFECPGSRTAMPLAEIFVEAGLEGIPHAPQPDTDGNGDKLLPIGGFPPDLEQRIEATCDIHVHGNHALREEADRLHRRLTALRESAAHDDALRACRSHRLARALFRHVPRLAGWLAARLAPHSR